MATLEERIAALEEAVKKKKRDWPAIGLAVAALIGAAIGAVPVIRDFVEEPPKQLVTLKNLERKPGWTYSEFIKGTGGQATLDKQWLEWPGAAVSFDIQLVGYKDEAVEATGWVAMANSGERVRDLWGIVTGDRVVANTQDDSENLEIWLPTPAPKGKYKVTVAVYDQEGSRLGQLSGKPFSVPPQS